MAEPFSLPYAGIHKEADLTQNHASASATESTVGDYLSDAFKYLGVPMEQANSLGSAFGFIPEGSRETGRALAMPFVDPSAGSLAAGALEASLIGAPGAKNLAKAGLRHADDWGGFNRFAAADDAYGRAGSKGLLQPMMDIIRSKIWKEHGVGYKAYGQTMPPYTAISDEGSRLTEDAGRLVAPLSKTFDHPLMFAAEPQMKDVLTNYRIGPSEEVKGRTDIRGVTGITPSEWEAKYGKGPTNGVGITVQAPNMRWALPTQTHENMHGLAQFQRLPQGGSPFTAEPRYDTPHGQQMAEKISNLRGFADKGLIDPDDPAFYEALAEAQEARLVGGRNAGYFSIPGEMLANGEASILMRGLPHTIERTHKNVDVFNLSDVMGPTWDKSHLRPFTFK